MRALPGVLLALALAAPTRAEEELPLAWARYSLEGPLERVELRGGRGTTLLELGFRPGERRELEVPIVRGGAAGEPQPAGADLDASLAERVRFLGWSDRPQAPALPATLRARPRPPWRPATPRVPAALALALLALGPVTLSLRRRPAWLALVGLLATVLAARVQARAAPPTSPPERVLEGTRDGQRWAVVDMARELELDPSRPGTLAVEPAGARVVLRGTLEEGAPRFVAASPDGALIRRAALDPGLRLLTPGLNTWGPLAETWTRPARESDWRAHGAWGLGQALAPGRAGRPPGWLAAGAVQGRGILIARLGPGAWAGGASVGPAAASGAGPPERATWLRLVGFE